MSAEPNQGATGEHPGIGAASESPLTVETEGSPFTERPEVFVGAAFAGGLALALIMRRITSE
jgi:hypothetical protein